MSTPEAIRDINEAIRALGRDRSLISHGEIRDAATGLLASIVSAHRRIAETPDTVAGCTCRDEWECGQVASAARLARTILAARDAEVARVGNGWVV